MAIVTIDGKDIEMIANAATGIVHERIFKEDIMNLSQKIGQEAAKKEELEEGKDPEYTEGDALAISLANTWRSRWRCRRNSSEKRKS